MAGLLWRTTVDGQDSKAKEKVERQQICKTGKDKCALEIEAEVRDLLSKVLKAIGTQQVILRIVHIDTLCPLEISPPWGQC